MRKLYYRDWQENAGYEDCLENQSNELQNKNEKAGKSNAVILNIVKEGTAGEPYVPQRA